MFTVASFYRFTWFRDPDTLRRAMLDATRSKDLGGTILLAEEGVNGTLAGTSDAVEALIDHVRRLPGCADIPVRYARSAARPFGRLKVRLKREIVTMGCHGVDPAARVGRYVDPEDWNQLISAPDVALIDTRNAYETAIGSFAGAIDPCMSSFGGFPGWWAENAKRVEGKRIAMFCTGGIRCEKATSWLIGQGVRDVSHLRGGILSYLETIGPDQSLWRGQCFVFDERVSVGHGLVPGTLELCRGCRHPMTDAERSAPGFEQGVSCHRCVDVTTPAQKARFRERERQERRARANGQRHVGA